MAFGSYLRQRRHTLGLSLQLLAQQTGVSASYLSRVERGLRNPPGPALLKRLAPVLQVEYTDLLHEAGHLPATLRELPRPYGLDTSEWQEALTSLSNDDWDDVRVLIQTKIARRRSSS